MSVGYLLLAAVPGAFHDLRVHHSTQAVIRQHPRVEIRLDYVQATYLDGQIYLPAMWNVHNRVRRNRTNNHCEAHYSARSNRRFAIAHPTLWTFITRLKDLQSRRVIRFAARDRGDALALVTTSQVEGP